MGIFGENLNEADRLVALLPTHTTEGHHGSNAVADPPGDRHDNSLQLLHAGEACTNSEQTQDDDRDGGHDREGALRHVLCHPGDQRADLRGDEVHHHLPLRTRRRWRHHPAGRLRRQPDRHRRVRGRLRQLLRTAIADVQDRLPQHQDQTLPRHPQQRLRPQLALRRR